jgi:hypothetical protein
MLSVYYVIYFSTIMCISCDKQLRVVIFGCQDDWQHPIFVRRQNWVKLNTQVMVAILIPESDVDTPNLKGWSRNLKAVVTVNQSVKLMTVACHIF